jgi:hypothetical protein
MIYHMYVRGRKKLNVGMKGHKVCRPGAPGLHTL